MTRSQTSFELFTLGPSIEGSPRLLDRSTLVELKAREVQELERWLRDEPRLMGEPLKIVSSQLAGFDKTLDRLDLLAVDQNGRLVVVEIKRNETSSGQDLQALRYAAYVSTMTAEQVVEQYRAYEEHRRGTPFAADDASRELEEFIEDDEGLAAIDDEDVPPRILLVATGFPVGVTSTVLWLSRNSRLDITCVQVTPYEIEGEIVIASSVLIPLPQAAEFEVRLQEKRRRSASRKSISTPIDRELARAFIESVPEGRWTSYRDVAVASGSPHGAQAIGSWLSRSSEVPANVYRVLKKRGTISGGYLAGEGSTLPTTPHEARQRLEQEGIRFDERDRADPTQRWTGEGWLTREVVES